VLLLDYLLFYPLVDLDSTDTQAMIQSAALPRYTSGEGVHVIPVVTLASAASTDCTVVYTNHAGVSGRTTTFRLLAGTSAGCIAASSDTSGATSASAPFMPLASGDLGVRSIESVTLASGVGGFCCFVLVKPLASVVVPEQNTASEVSFVAQKSTLPRILDGAYLNFAVKTQVNAASSWMGQFTFVEE
jgi:hypothetical protein